MPIRPTAGTAMLQVRGLSTKRELAWRYLQLMASPQKKLIWLCLCSAAVTTIARILNATDIAFDFPSQIQAAQHLLAGKGLSIYAWAVEGDLAGRARLLTMAHFPAGYSLCAATLIAMGFGVAAVVKTLGAVATILGWWGWAELAFCFFSDGLKRENVWRWAGYAIV